MRLHIQQGPLLIGLQRVRWAKEGGLRGEQRREKMDGGDGGGGAGRAQETGRIVTGERRGEQEADFDH